MERYLSISGCFLTFLLLTTRCSAQQLPYVPCPQYFQYLGFNQQYIGRISLAHDSQYEENMLTVELSQRGSLASNYVGTLSLWDDEDTVKYNLRNNIPIVYRIDFPTTGVLPRVTKITFNGNVICRGTPYPPTSVTLTLTHSLRSSITPLMSLGPQQQEFYPTFPQNRDQQNFVRKTQRPVQPSVQSPVQHTFTRPVQAPIPATVPTAPTASTATTRRLPAGRPSAPALSGAAGLLQLRDVCGREGPVLAPFIELGTEVAQGQLPWMVALLERVQKGVKFFCGGTLLSASTVVSAAHCFRFGRRDLEASGTAVSLGRTTLDLVASGELRDVSVLLIHEQYTLANYTDADIALLRLSAPVAFTEYIKPICLWDENYLLQLPSGHKGFVAGWGQDEHGNPTTRVAKMTDTNILTEIDCQQSLRAASVNFVTSRTICAINKRGAGPCHGDSGGGLMLQEGDLWLLRGIVSAGQSFSRRCDLTQPVIYTDLAKHIEWMHQNIWF